MASQKMFSNQSINVTFHNDEMQFKKLLLLIPGGPCLSSSYYENFVTHLTSKLNCSIGILDLPLHDNSATIPYINAQIASRLIWNTIHELELDFVEVSIFAHSFGGVLLFSSQDIKASLTGKLIFCGVPISLNKSDEYLLKKKSLKIPENIKIKTSSDYQEYFEMIAPLYFENSSCFNKNTFWKRGPFYPNGDLLLNDIIDISTQDLTLNIPLYIIDGDCDLVIPSGNSEGLRKKFVKVEQYLVKNSGHFPFLESPEDVINTLKYILKP